MAEESPDLSLQEKLVVLVGTSLGGVITWAIVTQLPIRQATVISSILLASLVVACAYLTNRLWWWMGVGAIAGIIIGLGGVMAGHLADEKEPFEAEFRRIFIVLQCLAGFIAGVILGRHKQRANMPTLTEFLAILGGLTVGLYALVVTGRFIEAGLIPAQELDDRLDAATTVLVTLLAVPGVAGYLLASRGR
jgi:pimeloyl-ACP methyl ester carboxylesterase